MGDRTPHSPLVNADWLRAAYEQPDVVVLDASWHMPATRRDGAAEFELSHIPGAAFFSIDDIADPDSPLPHMAPSAEAFATAVGTLGVGTGDHVVCYASDGIGTAPRAWWMFRLFGHERVSILDGGLPAWTAAGGSLAKGLAAVAARTFRAALDPDPGPRGRSRQSGDGGGAGRRCPQRRTVRWHRTGTAARPARRPRAGQREPPLSDPAQRPPHAAP